jgi:hypothetical protein
MGCAPVVVVVMGCAPTPGFPAGPAGWDAGLAGCAAGRAGCAAGLAGCAAGLGGGGAGADFLSLAALAMLPNPRSTARIVAAETYLMALRRIGIVIVSSFLSQSPGPR